MDHLVAAAELPVLVADRVEAVRAGGHDGLQAVAVQRLDVPGREHLVDVVVAHPAGRIARAGLLLAEDREAHARPRRGTSRTPARRAGSARRTRPRSRPSTGPRSRRAGPRPPAATVGTSNGSPLVQSVRVELGQAPRVLGLLHVPERGRELGREPRLLEHQVPPQPDDLVDVLDQHRARLDARAARHAVPDGVVRDRVVDDRLARAPSARAGRRGRTSRARSASSG